MSERKYNIGDLVEVAHSDTGVIISHNRIPQGMTYSVIVPEQGYVWSRCPFRPFRRFTAIEAGTESANLEIIKRVGRLTNIDLSQIDFHKRGIAAYEHAFPDLAKRYPINVEDYTKGFQHGEKGDIDFGINRRYDKKTHPFTVLENTGEKLVLEWIDADGNPQIEDLSYDSGYEIRRTSEGPCSWSETMKVARYAFAGPDSEEQEEKVEQ